MKNSEIDGEFRQPLASHENPMLLMKRFTGESWKMEKFVVSYESSNFTGGGGGEGHSYIIEDMDVRQGLSNPYPLQTKILDPFQTNDGKFSKVYTLKRRKMNF